MEVAGDVYNWGRGKHRILAQAEIRDMKSPRLVKLPEKIKALALGAQHTIALSESNQLYSWGWNKYGQLGHQSQQPEKVVILSMPTVRFRFVAAGANHTLAITMDGTVFAWGCNSDGQLGTGDTNHRFQPTEIKSKLKFISVACGATHSLGLAENMKIYSWGGGGDGKLGHGDDEAQLTPKEVFVHSKLKFSSIAAGEAHSVGLSTEGKVYTWGKGYLYRLGHGKSDQNVAFPREVKKLPSDSPIVQIAAGTAHTVALSASGEVWCTGWNMHGQIGDGTKEDTPYFKKVNLPPTAGKAIQIAAGHAHTMVLTEDGRIFGFGSGYAGQMGCGVADLHNLTPVETRKGVGVKRWVFVSAGGDHTAAIGVDSSSRASPKKKLERLMSEFIPRSNSDNSAASTTRDALPPPRTDSSPGTLITSTKKSKRAIERSVSQVISEKQKQKQVVTIADIYDELQQLKTEVASMSTLIHELKATVAQLLAQQSNNATATN